MTSALLHPLESHIVEYSCSNDEVRMMPSLRTSTSVSLGWSRRWLGDCGVAERISSNVTTSKDLRHRGSCSFFAI
jgi:hypothetical protein